MKVKDCMCNDICLVKPNSKVDEVAKLMCSNHVGCIPVCDDNNCIVGIVTDRDIILRSIACDKDVTTTPVSEIMTCDVCTCSQEDDMHNAEQKMCQNQIRRLPVIENNKIVGMLTIGDLAHYDQELGKDNVCGTISGICNCNGDAKNAQ